MNYIPLYFRYTVWVKRADADVKDNEARTPFHIIGVGNAVPNDRVEVSKLILNVLKISRNPLSVKSILN